MKDKTKQIIEVYDKIAEEYARIFDKDFSDKPFLDKFLKPLKKGNKVLDIGCGTGRSTKYIYDEGMNVQGIDLSSKMIEITKRNHPDIDFKQMDMREMDYEPDTFDGIWAGYSLFHIDKNDFKRLVRKIKEMLKSDGIFGLVMQEGEGEIEVEEPLLPGEKLYLWLWSLEELKEVLEENGFKVLDYDFKEPQLEGELSYRKILIVTRLIK